MKIAFFYFVFLLDYSFAISVSNLELISQDKNNGWIFYKIKNADFFKDSSLTYFTSTEINGKKNDECRKMIVDSKLNYILSSDGLIMKGKISVNDNLISLSAEEITYNGKVMPKNNGLKLQMKSDNPVSTFAESSEFYKKDSYQVNLVAEDPYKVQGIFTSCSNNPVCSMWCK